MQFVDWQKMLLNLFVTQIKILTISHGFIFKAYLIGVGDTSSEPGRAAIYDVNKYQYSIESLQQAIGRLNNSISSSDKQQLLDVIF